ncbi:MAG TPA: sigma-70 family RNA polymerase sigma factor [Acidobacteriaceae bacterium]|jgi:RNA polymerase sigma-70 factor (ECF subfamily)|nr:sigma-70 family RNA polymerase sigma factor [Acidobacteriaceae bacterium]
MDFEGLTNQHKDAVYRQMLRVCGNREDAEDVLIEALLRAWRHIDSLESAATFRAWLAQIARRVCFRVRRREALLPLEEMPEFDAAATAPGPEEQTAAAEMKSIVLGALAALPPAYRKVYELRDIEEKSGEEAAQQLGITLAAVKSRLHRARSMMRQSLDAQFGVTATASQRRGPWKSQ